HEVGVCGEREGAGGRVRREREGELHPVVGFDRLEGGDVSLLFDDVAVAHDAARGEEGEEGVVGAKHGNSLWVRRGDAPATSRARRTDEGVADPFEATRSNAADLFRRTG